MHVQVNGDGSVKIPAELASEIVATLENSLRLFATEITRVEVHLGDINADKGGAADKRCTLEARIAGMRPIAVEHHASTLEQALNGAAGKLQRTLSSTLGKMSAR